MRWLKAVVFDLDGTLVDNMSAILGNYVDTIRSLGGPNVGVTDVLANFHIGPTDVLLGHYLGRAVSDDDLNRYYAGYEAAVAGLKPLPGIAGMLASLAQDGYRLGIFTSAARRAVNILLSHLGLVERFDAIVAGDEVLQPKPAPDGLLLACRIMGVHASESAYVGDSDVDVECASRGGAFGICAVWCREHSAIVGGCEVAHDPSDVVSLARAWGRGF